MSLYLGGNEIDKVYIKNSINLQTKTADPSLQVQQILPDNTYDGLSSVQINPVILQDKTVSPTTSQQTVSYDSGYDGLNSVVIGAINLQSKSITPTTFSQTIIPDSGYDGLSSVGISAIKLQSKSISPTTSQQVVSVDSDCDGMSSVTVDAIKLQSKSISPSTSSQTITPDSGYNGLSSVTVGGYTAGITKLIRNDTSIVPTGSYATSNYYNTTYGVKIGYMSTGDILFSMQGGTTSSYEKLNFVPATIPSGVTLNSINVAASYTSGQPGLMYACVISGVTSLATLTVAMDYVSSTYDYTTVSISIAY